MKILFIYNPYAGHLQIKNELWSIMNVLAQQNFDITIKPTTEKGDAIDYIQKNAINYSIVVCSGGDGTLHEVVNGLMTIEKEKRPMITYIPAGSVNDYASSLNLPKKMSQAAQLINSKQNLCSDIGLFNDQYFVYIAAFGAFTEVSYSTKQEIKNLIGSIAYLLEGIKSLSDIKSYNLKVVTDDETFQGDFIYGMVSNSLSVGGLYDLSTKNVQLNDGEMELLLIKKPTNLLDLNSITAYLLNLEKQSEYVISRKIKRCDFISSNELDWTLDGEYGGKMNNVTISVLNKAIKIKVQNE